MLSIVTLDDNTGTPVVLHEDVPSSKRLLSEAHGLRGIQSLRSSKRVRPQAHGGINETKYEDGRNITLVGEVMSTISIEDCFAEFDQIAAAMMQTLDNGPALLKWVEGTTGNALQRLVKLDGDLDPPLTESQAVLTYQAQFFAEDPRAYLQALTSATSTPLATQGGGLTFPSAYPVIYASSGGGLVSYFNGGTRPTPPIYRIDGLCVNPQIVLVGPGLRLVFNGTIDAGDFLEIDVAKRTVMLGGDTPRLNFYDSANSTWFELGAGTTPLQLIAADFDGNAALTVSGRWAFA